MFPSAAAVSRFNLQPSVPAAPSRDWMTGVPTAFAAPGHSALFTFRSERSLSCQIGGSSSSSTMGLFSGVAVEGNPVLFWVFFRVERQLCTITFRIQ